MATKSSIEGQMLKDCRQQNEHYWRIIEKQKAMIQNLQDSLTQLSDSYEILYQRKQDTHVPDFDSRHVTQFTVESVQQNTESVQPKVPDHITLGPVPPPRSPYRINQGFVPSTNLPDKNLSTFETTRLCNSYQFPKVVDCHKRPPALRLSISNHQHHAGLDRSEHTQDILLSPIKNTSNLHSPLLSPCSLPSVSDTSSIHTISRSFNDLLYEQTTPEIINKPSISSPIYPTSPYRDNTYSLDNTSESSDHILTTSKSQPFFERHDGHLSQLDSPNKTLKHNLKGLRPSLSEPNTPVKARTPRYDSLTPCSLPNSCQMTSFETSANRRRFLSTIQNVSVKYLHSLIDAQVDDPLIVISIQKYTTSSVDQKELWCVEKRLSEIYMLDHIIRKSHPNIADFKLLPEKAIFTTQTPAKIDQRKYMIETYFNHVISIKSLNSTYLIEFLDSGVIPHKKQKVNTSQEVIYQGYISVQDKCTGSWLPKYFVLESNGLLKYSDPKTGASSGVIHLFNAKIGHQITSQDCTINKKPSYSFFILECNKTLDLSYKHILRAESDIEREAWIAVIRNYVHMHITESIVNDALLTEDTSLQSPLLTFADMITESSSSESIKHQSDIKKKSPHHMPKCSRVPTASLISNNPSIIPVKSAKCNKSPATEARSNPSEETEGRKKSSKNRTSRRTFWNKVKFNSSNEASPKAASNYYDQDKGTYGRKQVFGIPLQHAASISRISDTYELPAIVHRCIEYIEVRGGLEEEGIYRLSGSAAKIKVLKKKFNEEGDLELLKDNGYNDVHEVSGILKMWLRELPENILTHALLNKFIHALGLQSQQEKVHELGRLVSLLPTVNYTLLRSLCAHFIRIVEKSHLNKMTMRNISIVFSATLDIPAGIFSLFLIRFDYIFWTNQCSPDQMATIDDTYRHYMDDMSSEDSTLSDSSVDNSSAISSNTTYSSNIQTYLPVENISSCSRSKRNSNLYQETAPKDVIYNEHQLDANMAHFGDDDSYISENELEVAYVASRYNANSKKAVL